MNILIFFSFHFSSNSNTKNLELNTLAPNIITKRAFVGLLSL